MLELHKIITNICAYIQSYKSLIFTIDNPTIVCYNIITARETGLNKTASVGKENGMEDMTNEQFKTFIKMIIQIIEDSKDKTEAVKKIEALITKD